MLTKKAVELERRQYLRLDSVFPVEFQVLGSDGIKALSGWLQGFTCNISAGGMGLTVNNIDQQIALLLAKKEIQLSLRINIPLAYPATKATGVVAWFNQAEGASPNQYQIGVKYLAIDRQNVKRIMRYARWLRFSSRFAIILAVALLIALGAVFVHNLKLRLENRFLVYRLVGSIQKYELAKKEMDFLKTMKDSLTKNLSIHKNRIGELEEKMAEAQLKLQKGLEQNNLLQHQKETYLSEIARLKQLILLASQEEDYSQEKLSKVQEREVAVFKELSSIDKEKQILKGEAAEKMLKWLKVHQNNHTGLLLSYEGDRNLKDWAFIYDQSLAAQAFILFGDYENAQKIFNFFNRISRGKFSGFYNAYYSSAGEVAEYAIHAGPNIWLGIAIMQYSAKTKDLSYLPLAQKIAGWLIALQEQDPEGGLRGGERVTWFSTEHNLDGFAFYKMLYKMTNDKRYELASRKILNWLITHAYGGQAPPIKRGKGDSTVATDTYAWSIAAIGPRRLKDIGMDAEKIMEFAEENCAVSVNFKRPDGKTIEVKGFDFAKYTNMPRGGLVSSEWTAQMVISYQSLSDFFAQEKKYEKQEFYHNKASFYLNELSKLVISSPSPTGQGEGCLPYATSENADTGHGWRTPKGSSTGSIAATCYAIFAQKNYNPLQIGAE